MIWSIPTIWQFPELSLKFLPMTSHKQTSQIPDIRFYLQFLRSGLWMKLAYQVMLTIRGRLIIPFILGSMSVGLNILICHSFTDVWALRLGYHDHYYFIESLPKNISFFNIGGHPQNFARVMALVQLSFCCCVIILVLQGHTGFIGSLQKDTSLLKCRSSSILVIIRKILTNLGPFFDCF